MQITSGHAYHAQVFPDRMERGQHLSASTSVNFAHSLAIPTDKVTISQTAHTAAIDDLTKTSMYDFSHMTPQRLLQVMNDEIKKGRLSLDESGSMLLLIPISLTDGSPPSEYYMPTNLFSRMEQWLKFNQSIHNDTAVVYDQMALSALRRLQGTPSEV